MFGDHGAANAKREERVQTRHHAYPQDGVATMSVAIAILRSNITLITLI
jgi:hypothetical protein